MTVTVSKRNATRKARRLASGAAAAWLMCFTVFSGHASAQTTDVAAEIARLAERLAQQEERIAAQERQLKEQRAQIEAQARLLATQRTETVAAPELAGESLDALRGTGAGGPLNDGLILLGQAASPSVATTAGTVRPVGEAPPAGPPPTTVAALPEGQGVLTPRGRLTLDPSLEYTRSSSNRLIYRGVEIVTGIQVGVIEANDVDRDTVVTSLSARYGLTPRLEVEARIPYAHRYDRILQLAQRNTSVSRTQELDATGLGDVEASARYQLNSGASGRPILVAGLRVKSDTGTGPFDIKRDAAGVAEELALGSGFWGVSPTLSVMYPSDPVVLFGSLSYLYNAPKDINKTIGAATIGRVDPGDSIGAGVGFGFALNDRFSYSMGYQHSYLFETKTEIAGTEQSSPALHVGALQFGMSYRLNPRVNLSTNFEIGATKDSPDVRAVIRVPVSLQIAGQRDASASTRTASTERSWWSRMIPRW